MSWKFVVSLLVALIVAVFAILNSEPVAINFLFKKAVISQALVILISVIVGALIVALLGSISRFKQASALKEERHKVEELEKVIEGLSEKAPNLGQEPFPAPTPVQENFEPIVMPESEEKAE